MDTTRSSEELFIPHTDSSINKPVKEAITMKNKTYKKGFIKIMTRAIGLLLICSLAITALAACGAAGGSTIDEVPLAVLAPTEYDVSDATVFVFSDSGIEVTEGAYAGYKTEGTALAITEGGTYVVSGSCSDGTIVVKKNVTGVTLVLDGLKLSASATAPITCNKGSEARIIAAEGTVNNLADDEFNNDDVYTDETLYPDIENAVIKCKDGSNVTICGTGTINVTANGKNGVKGGYDLYEEDEDGNATEVLLSEASLTVKEVTLNITATAGDGLKSDKELNILSGNITVSAADDGIKSDYVLNIGSEGYVGPTITVTEADEGIEAATLNVYTGNVTVNASDDGINAANSDLENYEYSYNQYGGYVWVNVTAGDGVDSNGTINLYGGVLEVYSPSEGDGDPLDSDNGINFAGATVLAVGSLGMQQAFSATTPYVTFGGGSAGGFPGGGNPPEGFDGNADGSMPEPPEGFDGSADGSMPEPPEGFDGSAPDFGGGFGGSQSELAAAGSTITITDSDGNVLYTAEAVRSASYVLFVSPLLESGSTYTLKNGDTDSATATAGTSSTNGMGGRMPGGFGDGSMPTPPDGGSETPPALPDGEASSDSGESA